MYRHHCSQLAVVNCVLGVLAGSVLLIAPSPANAQADNGRVDVLIGFGKTPGPNERALVRGHGGRIKYSFSIVPAIAASVPEKGLAKLSKARGVRRVELDGTVHASTIDPGADPELANSWGVDRIDAEKVHPTNMGDGVRIAILDTGIDYTHLDLVHCYAGGYDFVNADGDPLDDRGHGTHVAGTIAAAADGEGVVGVAPGAEIYALKVLDERGVGFFSDIIAALQWCVDKNNDGDPDNDIDVTNNSYGAKRDPGSSVQEAFDNAAAAGILHVAAAGNSGKRNLRRDTVEYPAAYGSVVAVGAVDKLDVRPQWSSTGSTLELAAPGVGILSTFPGGTYVTYNGTSMASPHVAGTAALVIAANPGLIGDPEGIRILLCATADDLGDPGPDYLYGCGLVDAELLLPEEEDSSLQEE